MSRIKLLFVAANTDPDAILELDKEYERIRQYLYMTPEFDALEIVHEPKGSADSLLHLFERVQPDIVHFAAHADRKGRVKLHATDGGGLTRVTPEALGQLFGAIKKKAALVVFNACYSNDAADALRDFVPFRIGTKGEIADEIAILFSSSFYQALGLGRTVWDACKYAHAAVAVTFGNVPSDEIGQLDESPGARATEFRLRSPRIQELEQKHRERIRRYVAVGIPLVASASILGSMLVFPRFGWQTPSLAKAKNAAIDAFTAADAFYKNEITDLGGDTSPPAGYPPVDLNPTVNTSKEELVPENIKEPTRKEAARSAMDEWRNDIVTKARGSKEELLVLRSKEDFKPPYKSCSYSLTVTSSVRITRAAAFLVRDGGGDTAYRPTYRQMKLQFKPDRDREGTLFLSRPRKEESLLVYLSVSTVPTNEKLDINGKPRQFFNVTLSDMEPQQ